VAKPPPRTAGSGGVAGEAGPIGKPVGAAREVASEMRGGGAMLFYWNSSLETGSAEIDRQHRRLFELTNDLAELVGGGGRLPDVGEVIANLRDYAEVHFASEEQIMLGSTMSPAELDRHVHDHRAFIGRVDEIAARSDLSETQAIEQFLEFLVTWLVMHILRMDMRIVREEAAADDLSVEWTLIKALNETERRFRAISDDAPAMIWISGRTGRRDYANRAWFEYVGAPAKSASDVEWERYVHPDDIAHYRAVIDDVIERPRRSEIELRVRRPDGTWGWVIERILPRIEGSRCVGLVAAASDVTVIKQSEEVLAQSNRRIEREVAQRTRQLERMVLTDPLTGVGNRRAAFEDLAGRSGPARGGRGELSLLYLDIDHFKRINDEFGHAAGDTVLMAVAGALVDGCGTGPSVYRIGGEEFIAILPGAGIEAAVKSAERLRAMVAAQRFTGIDRKVTVSVGAATLRAGESDEDLIKRADDALLEAKRSGRDRVCRWHAAAVPAGQSS
jgi:diguanylate cyclase (GGDEF)-like protein/hemerythrin-like metal-binding protein/PAS domain S-box-containing protein